MRILAFWLILLLGLPSPLFALRSEGPMDAGLEEQLRAALDSPSSPSPVSMRRLATRWNEPTSRSYSARLVGEFNKKIGQEKVNAQRNGLHNEVTRDREQPFLERRWWGELQRGSQRRGIEKWVDRRGGVYFIRIGPLFFVDQKKAALLSGELLDKLGANVIRIHDLTSSRLADSPLLGPHERVGPYSYPAVFALLETDVAGKVLFDAGGGKDLLFAFIGKAFGAAAVIGIELEGELVRQARVNFVINHLEQGKDAFLVQADLTKPDDIRRELEAIQAKLQQPHVPIKEAVLVSTTGTWPFYTANNRSGITLIPVIAKATGLSVTSVIGAGLIGDWRQTTAAQATGELRQDMQAVQAQGFSVSTDLFRFSAMGIKDPDDHFYTVAWLATKDVTGAGPSSAGLEEKISAEEAKGRVDQLKAQYEAGTPLREVSRKLSEVVYSLIREIEEQAKQNLERKVTAVQLFGDGSSRAQAFEPEDSALKGKAVVQFKGKKTFTAVTGGLGRGDDFLFSDDIDVIIFPVDEDSVQYAQALHKELIDLLEESLKRVGLAMTVDRRLTGQFDFQIPPARVPEKLLVPKVQIFYPEHQMWLSNESPLTDTPFRDLRFVSGDQPAFDDLMNTIAAPLLYPYGDQGQVVNPKGEELVRVLLSSAVQDAKRTLAKSSDQLDGIDMKEDALRHIQRYVWVMRAKTGIRAGSVFDALQQFASRKILSPEEAVALAGAYEFFLRTSNGLVEAQPAAVLSNFLKGEPPDYRLKVNVLPQVAQRLKMTHEKFRADFSLHLRAVREIALREFAEGQVPQVGLEERLTQVLVRWGAMAQGSNAVVVPHEIQESRYAGSVRSVLAALPPQLAGQVYVEGSWAGLEEANPSLHVISGGKADVVIQVLEGNPSYVWMLGDDPGFAGMFTRSRIPIRVIIPGAGLEEFLVQMGKILGVPDSEIETGLEELKAMQRVATEA